MSDSTIGDSIGTTRNLFTGSLPEVDSEASLFVGLEEARQADKIILIPSESIAPKAVRDALGTVFTNIYAEGYPSLRMTREELDLLMDNQRGLAYHRRYSDRRFYKGTEFVDFVEVLAQRRAAAIFATPEFPPDRVFVNVQPLSGAAANNAVYEAFVEPGGVVMGMALTHGGHLTHGSEFNRSGKRYKIVPYEVSRNTGRLDYDAIEKLAQQHRPRMIIAGASAYPWDIDWKRLRAIADAVPAVPIANVMGGSGAILLADVSHPAGLVVAGLFSNPVGHAHVSTLTTHKTICGPRGAIILSTDPEVAKRIDNAVFPGEQGGPHINNIAAKAVAFKIAATEEFKQLQKLIVANCRALGDALVKRGLKLAYGGTETHLLVVDLNAIKTRSSFPLKGDVASNILDICGITCNRNTIPGDRTAADSSGVRFGTVFMTQRGMKPEHADRLAELITRVLLSIETFGIPTALGKRGRGKIEMTTVQETLKAVAGFVAAVAPRFAGPSSLEPVPRESGRYNTAMKKTPRQQIAVSRMQGPKEPFHLETDGTIAVLEVRGERLLPFLQAASTCDVLDLEPGTVRRSALLTADAALVANLLIVCAEPTAHGERRAKLLLDSAAADKAVEWLSHLSDGFVKFDNHDVFAKIDGPVVVHRCDAADAHVTVRGDHEAQEIRDFVKSARESAALEPLTLVKKAEQSDIFSLTKPYFIGQRRLIEELYLSHARPEEAAKEEVCPIETGPKTIRIRKKLHIDKRPFEWTAPVIEPRKSCLYKEHLKPAKKQNMVEFASWLMPVMYSGIVDEHLAVRTAAAVFDVSHMGVFDFRGPHAERFLDLLTTNYVLKLRPGQSQYSYVLDPDGKVLDDIMVYRLARERFLVVANAVNAEKIKAWVEAVNSRDYMIDRAFPFKEIEHPCEFRYLKDISAGADMLVDLAIQGPCSLAILEAAYSPLEKGVRGLSSPLSKGVRGLYSPRRSGGQDVNTPLSPLDRGEWRPPERLQENQSPLRALKRAELTQLVLGGIPVIVSRTGYTGEEFGYELFVHPEKAPALWNLLLEVGTAVGLKPAGLGARDSTRTEAGLPLYGHELAGQFDISPAEAGYGTFVKRHKPFFIGKRALLEKEAKAVSEIVRFRVSAKGAKVVRPGNAVVNRKGQCVGTVTSAALDADGFQTGMAFLIHACAPEGTWLGIFSGKHEAGFRLEPGSRVPLHEEAVVLPRFRQQQATK